MDDAVGVEVLEGHDDLVHVVLGLELGEPFPALDQFVESLVGAYFQQDVDVVVVFEDVFELGDVGVLDAPVDLDLRD